YTGSDENDNVQLGKHARMLRTLVDLPGGPTVLVTCHPTKNPNLENLQPRGGGSFLAEIDGNVGCVLDRGSMTVEVATHGKFRGPEFSPLMFRLVSATSDKLKDDKGRSIWTVYAETVSAEETEAITKTRRTDQDVVLRALLEHPGLSIAGLAKHLLWLTNNGDPNKTKVYRILEEL